MTQPDLANIVENAVTMMLGVSLGDVTDGDVTSTYSLGASVQFTGEWEGAVVVGCSESFGREAAAALFASAADAVEPDEVADALGELANIIGGNVKPLLPRTASLSLPTVVRGAEVHLGIPGAALWVGISYGGDSAVSVRIYERAS
jgi:chemotaxis protein CheX